MYNVVFRTSLKHSTFNAITWVPFGNVSSFNEQYNERARELHKIVEEDVSNERAAKLCSDAEVALVIVASKLREF